MSGGGLSILQLADVRMQELCDEVKKEVLKRSGKNSFVMYVAIVYRSQTVAGTNDYVKIMIDTSGECIHALIFEELPCNGGQIQLMGIQTNKTVWDPI